MTGGLILPDPAATEAAGRALAPLLVTGDVVMLSGDLGAGKTAFARGVLRGLGFAGDVPSPTFAIVQPYTPPETTLAVAHVDLYRLEEPGDIAELGLDEYRDEGILLVEWPERLDPSAWPQALRLRLDPANGHGRRLTWQAPEAWEARWPPELAR